MLYGHFTFRCILNDEAILPPFKGSTFRGAFGSALKHVVCALKRKDCRECLLNSRCIYSLVFEKKDRQRITGRHMIPQPHPFVIEPPLNSKVRIKPGEEFNFNLICCIILEFIFFFIYFLNISPLIHFFFF